MIRCLAKSRCRPATSTPYRSVRPGSSSNSVAQVHATQRIGVGGQRIPFGQVADQRWGRVRCGSRCRHAPTLPGRLGTGEVRWAAGCSCRSPSPGSSRPRHDCRHLAVGSPVCCTCIAPSAPRRSSRRWPTCSRALPPTRSPVDVVAVPTKGVERWLAQRLSHRLGAAADGEAGVCAGVGFASPSRLVAGVLAGALDLDPGKDPWSVEALTWTVLAVDRRAPDRALVRPAGPPPRRAGRCAARGAPAGGRPSPRGAVRLLRRTASAAAGRLGGRHRRGSGRRTRRRSDRRSGRRWRPADLVVAGRAVASGPGPDRRAEPRRAPDGGGTAVASRPGRAGAPDLPERLSVFGPTRLPQAQLEVLDALSAHRDVHLWLPHPSPVLWQRVLATPRISPCRPTARRWPGTRCWPRWPETAVELQQRLFAPAGGPSTVTDTHHPPRAPAVLPRPGGHRACWWHFSDRCARTLSALRTTATVRGRRDGVHTPARPGGPQHAGARLPRAGPAGRGAARGDRRPAPGRPHAAAARRAGDVPRHRGVRPGGGRGLRAGGPRPDRSRRRGTEPARGAPRPAAQRSA